jgi:uncharacterized protein (DUF983 family)
MSTMSIQVVFSLVMVALVIVGFFCAAKLSGDYPLWVRMIVLYPSLAALCTLGAMLKGHYVAYTQDIVLAVGIMLLYAVVASRFTNNPWLDIRVAKKA